MFGGHSGEKTTTGGWFGATSTEFLLNRGNNDEHSMFVLDDQ